VFALIIALVSEILRRFGLRKRQDQGKRATDCLTPPDQIRARPDPFTYSQHWLAFRGMVVKWNNPDFQIRDAGGAVVENHCRTTLRSRNHSTPRLGQLLLVMIWISLVAATACHRYTGFRVVGNDVDTKLDVQAGQDIHLTASETVDFGGAVVGLGAPKLDADGDSNPTPSDYPAPALRKNSLIARVGDTWYQGGVDKEFGPVSAGRLYLRANDAQTEDNSGGWDVHVKLGQVSANDFGPLPVVNQPVTTVEIKAGSTVHVTSTGKIDFGGAVAGIGAPVLDADGDSVPTPTNYPAPGLRKNSLIVKVGQIWYQGGTNAQFVPPEDGIMVVQPNDAQLEDNSRSWMVTVHIIPLSPGPAPVSYGPFSVSNVQINTNISVKAGHDIHIDATGLVDFGGAVLGIGAPILGPNGDNYPTPRDYPAPSLKKNSLIVRVGSVWYQGGTTADIVPTQDGVILIQPNDSQLSDNSRGWQVTVTVR
jgi:hypothetical protein